MNEDKQMDIAIEMHLAMYNESSLNEKGIQKLIQLLVTKINKLLKDKESVPNEVSSKD